MCVGLKEIVEISLCNLMICISKKMMFSMGSMGMQYLPDPRFVPTTDAAYFPLEKNLNPAPPARKKGGGKGKGKGKGTAKK